MVSQTARRRINTISGHIHAGLLGEDVTSPTTKLFPLNCSSNITTAFKRLDNRLNYGRQASAAQGYFMKQASDVSDKSNVNDKKSTTGSPTPPLFSRLGSGEPRFARPVTEFNCFPKVPLAPQCPEFGRHIEQPSEKKMSSCSPMVSSQINGKEWSPRINVIESKHSYIIAVELPGVDIKDIRVEMDDKNLIVRGQRSTEWWKQMGGSNDSGIIYHKREISQGEYQVVWPLPPGVNEDSISAEFIEGILQITLPKI